MAQAWVGAEARTAAWAAELTDRSDGGIICDEVTRPWQ